jgi:uncharacterized protein YeaO (DUF488 family)
VKELGRKTPLLVELLTHARQGVITLVYGARDVEHNQAVVIREVLRRPAKVKSDGRQR